MPQYSPGPTVGFAPMSSSSAGRGGVGPGGRRGGGNYNGKNNGKNKKRPSEDRRAALRRADGTGFPDLNNFLPIERYYAAAEKVLAAFDDAYDRGKLDDAYVFGRRFATFSTSALPKHDYYKSPKTNHVRLKRKNQSDLEWVVSTLEKIVALMDAEELEKEKEREEAERQKQQLEELNVDDKLARLNELFPRAPEGFGPSSSQSSMQLSRPMTEDDLALLTEKLDEPSQQPPPPPPPPPSYTDLPLHSNLPVPLAPPPEHDSSGECKMEAPADHEIFNPLSPPPSYDQIYTGTPGTTDGGGAVVARTELPRVPSFRRLSLYPAEEISPTSPVGKVKKKEDIVPIKRILTMCNQDLKDKKQRKQVEVFMLGTYQGRIKVPDKDSTNGCAVISPLVAARHLECPGSGIADMTIEDIIDSQAPPILRAVRSKLGLGSNALIIPSDVHDYLVDKKILRQEKFVGVCGGNILDKDHMGEFLKLIVNGSEEGKGDNGKKAAATLYFHEHVVSILKVVLSSGVCWFDIIDSMPADDGGPEGDDGDLKATRTRCKDRESLELTIRWYACNKFSESNCDFIDQNNWDENMCDFDPRVFQAFVWTE